MTRSLSRPLLATTLAAAALAGASSCGPSAPPCASGTICTAVGTGQPGLTADGEHATRTRVYQPQDMVVGPDGLLYFIDWNNHRIRVRQDDGSVRTVVGTGELGDGPPGPATQHRLNHPTDLLFDGTGRMLVAAWHNSKIKRVDLRAGTAEDICGTGARAFGGDNGPASTALLDLPAAIALSPSNELFIADQANQRIRRVDAMGIITTIAGDGTPGYNGDGIPAAMARLSYQVGQAAQPGGRIAFDPQGNLYVADTNNHRVRRIDAQTGIIETIAGTGVAGYGGDGGPATAAQVNTPTDVEVGPDGTIYVADTQNSCVRTIGTDGVIRTFAGRCGMRGFDGDGGDPTTALLNRPYGVEVDAQGNVWIADTYNNRIRMVMR